MSGQLVDGQSQMFLAQVGRAEHGPMLPRSHDADAGQRRARYSGAPVEDVIHRGDPCLAQRASTRRRALAGHLLAGSRALTLTIRGQFGHPAGSPSARG